MPGEITPQDVETAKAITKVETTLTAFSGQMSELVGVVKEQATKTGEHQIETAATLTSINSWQVTHERDDDRRFDEMKLGVAAVKTAVEGIEKTGFSPRQIGQGLGVAGTGAASIWGFLELILPKLMGE